MDGETLSGHAHQWYLATLPKFPFPVSALDSQIKAAKPAVVSQPALFIPVPENESLLPFQRTGVEFLVGAPNALLADDMGVGKTVQAVAYINAIAHELDRPLKVLVICPATLTYNWRSEIGAWQTTVHDMAIYSTGKDKHETDISIVSYSLFSRDTVAAKHLLDQHYDLFIADEAHYLKNDRSKRTRTILGGKRTPGIVADRTALLTGTPILNRPIELWPLLNRLAPGDYADKRNFAIRYCNGRFLWFGRKKVWDDRGASNLDELQQRLRSSVMLRRTKAEVLPELPDKTRQLIEIPKNVKGAPALLRDERQALDEVNLSFDQAVDQLVDGDSATFNTLATIRRELGQFKAAWAIPFIENVLSHGKVIVFACHRDVIALLGAHFKNASIISGSTPVGSRPHEVEAFQDGDRNLFIGQLQAAGTGLTLTAASHVIFVETDWTPATNEQCEDRALRIGQKNAVTVQYLALEGSLDARILKTFVEKQKVVNQALNKERS